MLRTAQSQKKPESQKKSPKRLRRRPALWLRDLLPRSYSVAQHQALYRAARGLREVTSNIHGVSQATRDASTNAQKVNAAALALRAIAQELQRLVSRFVVSREA